MVTLKLFFALCSLFTFAQCAAIAQPNSECALTTLDGAIVDGQVKHPLYFCTWYLEEYVWLDTFGLEFYH